MEFFKQLSSSDFIPHGFCYLRDPRILWLHVISDRLIALSYYCSPIILVYFIRKNRDLPFTRIFWMFGNVILACGTTHLMDIWNVWHSSYLIAGVVKAVTATVSVVTTAMLIPLVLKVISLPSRMHLEKAIRKLEDEIAEHKLKGFLFRLHIEFVNLSKEDHAHLDLPFPESCGRRVVGWRNRECV